MREGVERSGSEALAPAAFYRGVSSFCTMLIDVRGEFDGDIDRFLIYLIVLLDDLARAPQPERNAVVGVSALSIAEITGIPRETVRRKLAMLIEDGVLTRQGHAHYHVTAAGPPWLVGRLGKLLAEGEPGVPSAADRATPCA